MGFPTQAWVFAFYAESCGGCCDGGTWEVQAVDETPDCINIDFQGIGCSIIACDGPAECACAVLVAVPQTDKPICVNGNGPLTCPWP